MYRNAGAGRIYDDPVEVHMQMVARLVLRTYEPVDVPTQHIPSRRERAQANSRSCSKGHRKL